MDDPLLVGVLHRLADRHEQLQAGPDREPQAVAVLGDRLPAHQLHHEERLAGLGGAAVVDAGDVGVVHQGQPPARSASNRASTARESIPTLISLSATCRLTG